MRVTESAPTALARATASSSGDPRPIATASAPLKASPAAVLSTASTSMDGMITVCAAVATSAPREPRVTITCFGPAARRRTAACRAESSSVTAMPVSRAASVSFGVT